MTTAPTPTHEQRVREPSIVEHPVPERTSPTSLLLLLMMPLTIATMVGVIAWLTMTLR